MHFKKAIHYREFARCKQMPRFFIPNTIIKIEEAAFEDCTDLHSIVFSDDHGSSSSYLEEFGKDSFYNCISLEFMSIPNTVTKIGYRAFYCTKLKSLILTDKSSLAIISDNAFHGCHSIESIWLPRSLEIIGKRVFYECSQLQSITFSDRCSIQELGERTFFGCKSLQMIIIPSSVKKLGMGVFQECTNLKSVLFAPGSCLQWIESLAFDNCTSLQFILLPQNECMIIGRHVFHNCKSLQVLALPHGVSFMDDHKVFNGCDALQCSLQNGMDWLQSRFEDLPLHQLCYRDLNKLASFMNSCSENDEKLLQQDVMGMTPLHILCANPLATTEILNKVCHTNKKASYVENSYGMTPWDIYLTHKGCLKAYHHFRLPQKLKPDIHDLIAMGENYHVIYVSLLHSKCPLEQQIDTVDNEDDGFFPFMSMAESEHYNLSSVYEMALKSVSLLRTMPRDP